MHSDKPMSPGGLLLHVIRTQDTRRYTLLWPHLWEPPCQLNTDLALALITKGRAPAVVVQAPELCRLEGAIARSLEAQNFNFWYMGAFYCLFYSLQPVSLHSSLADQLFKSIQRAMVDVSSDSALALAISGR